MSANPTSYLSPKLEARKFQEKGGYGVFAIAPVACGELLTVWSGVVIPEDGLSAISTERSTHGIQVEEGFFLVPIGELEPADMFNHSCTPNAGLSGQITLVAMRDIAAGEEICFDYATSDSNDYDVFDCHCGAPGCRGKVTGSDWALPELQKRYKGYFTPYLQRRIDRLNG
jgi:SET domain-containing protein